MQKPTYKSWDDVPEEVQLKALTEAIDTPGVETGEEIRRQTALNLNIPPETIPPGEFVEK